MSQSTTGQRLGGTLREISQQAAERVQGAVGAALVEAEGECAKRFQLLQARVVQLESEKNNLQISVGSQSRVLSQQARDRASLTEEIKALKDQETTNLVEKHTAVEELRGEKRQADLRFERVKERLDNERGRIGELVSDVDQLKQVEARLSEELNTKAAECLSLHHALDKYQGEHNALLNKASKLQEENLFLTTTLENKDALLHNLRNNLRDVEEELTDTKHALHKLQSECASPASCSSIHTARSTTPLREEEEPIACTNSDYERACGSSVTQSSSLPPLPYPGNSSAGGAGAISSFLDLPVPQFVCAAANERVHFGSPEAATADPSTAIRYVDVDLNHLNLGTVTGYALPERRNTVSIERRRSIVSSSRHSGASGRRHTASSGLRETASFRRSTISLRYSASSGRRSNESNRRSTVSASGSGSDRGSGSNAGSHRSGASSVRRRRTASSRSQSEDSQLRSGRG
eukprot:g13554.t1